MKKELTWITNENGCHVCNSHVLNEFGYVCYQRPGFNYAHRWVWTKKYGEIPKGLVIMHLCDNPSCINIEHLKLGTQSDNIRDKINKNRQPEIPVRISRKRSEMKNNINKIRLEKKLRQSELAKMIGVNQTHLSRVERGQKNFSLEVMQKVAKALNVSIDELLIEN